MHVRIAVPVRHKVIGAALAAAAVTTAGIALTERNEPVRTQADPFYCIVITHPEGLPVRTICIPKPFVAA